MNIIESIFSNKSISKNKIIIVKNVYWAVLGKIINILSGLFVGIMVARYLGPSKYGIMNYVLSYVTIFSVISVFGLDNIEIKELSKKDVIIEEVLGTSFIIRVIFSVLAIVVIYLITISIEKNDYIVKYVIIYSFSILFGVFNNIRNYFTSIVLNEYIVKVEIVRTVMGSFIKLLLLLLKAPLELFLFSFVFDFILIASGYIYSYRKKVGSILKWKYKNVIAKKLINESLPLLWSSLAVIIYQQIDQVMLKFLLDNKSVGYFATASKITDLFFFIPIISAQTITPLLIKAKERDIHLYYNKRQEFVDVILWSSILISIFVSFISYWLVRYTFGIEYIQAGFVLRILIWKSVGMALAATSGQLMIIEGIHKYAVIRNVVGCFVSIIMNYLLIPSFGIIGSAYVGVLSVMFAGFLSNIMIPAYYNIMKIQIKSIVYGWKSIVDLKNNIMLCVE
jgi:O-antigen/teichoic acid export membrane protein